MGPQFMKAANTKTVVNSLPGSKDHYRRGVMEGGYLTEVSYATYGPSISPL